MKAVRSTKAFTLIELLAATALAALFMLAVMSVIGSIGRGQRAMNRQEDRSGWSSGLLDALRWDLRNCAAIEPAEDRLVLHGFGSLDRITRAASNRPVTIVYQVVTIGDRRWLVRRQREEVDTRANTNWSELLCADVQSVEVQGAAPQSLQNVERTASTRPTEISGSVRIRVVPVGEGRAPVDEVVWLH